MYSPVGNENILNDTLGYGEDSRLVKALMNRKTIIDFGISCSDIVATVQKEA